MRVLLAWSVISPINTDVPEEHVTLSVPWKVAASQSDLEELKAPNK